MYIYLITSVLFATHMSNCITVGINTVMDITIAHLQKDGTGTKYTREFAIYKFTFQDVNIFFKEMFLRKNCLLF